MDNNDRQAIDGLFNRLSQVESQAGPRDADAESVIKERVAAQPTSPYFMAQTIVVQEQALNAAQQRIEQLEYEAANRPSSGGGLFSSLFGGGSARPAPQQPMRSMPMNGAMNQQQPESAGPSGPWGQQSNGGMQQRGGGGGFLAGAAQTAMGVAGGVLLGNAIAGMFAGDTASAAPAAEPQQNAEQTKNEDADADADAGGDMEF